MYVILSESFAVERRDTTSMYAITNARDVHIFQIFDFDCNTTMLLSPRRGMLFVRLQPISLDWSDRVRTELIAETWTIFFLHQKGGPTHTGDANETRAGGIELRRLTGIDSRARSRENARSSLILATLGNPFDRAIDIQTDERHVRNAFVIKSWLRIEIVGAPQRQRTTRWTFRGWCIRMQGTGGASF